MFAIVISEKGGAERRETFEKPTVTVGRVQDNDLTLPKGNVSKRHCRLEMSEGRFIVTDEDSTNGTYVNRRRITQPTVIREGDRLYVGDFVLRLEHQPAEAAPLGEAVVSSDGQPAAAPRIISPGQRLEPEPAQINSPFESVAPFTPSVPALGPQTSVPPDSLVSASLFGDSVAPESASMAPRSGSLSPNTQSIPPKASPASTASPPSAGGSASSGYLVGTGDLVIGHSPLSAAVRGAARSLIEEVWRRIEPGLLLRALDRDSSERLERIVVEQSGQLASLGHALDAEQVQHALTQARSELFGLGPLDALLEDAAVTEVVVTAATDLVYYRDGFTKHGVPFCHPRSPEWVLGRLCRQSGVDLNDSDTLVRRLLERPGLELHAVRDGVSVSGTMIRLKRRRGINIVLDDLVHLGTLSRAMATFLRHCVMARANVLLVGRRDSGMDELLSALTTLVAREPLAWLSWNGINQVPPPGIDCSCITVSPDVDGDTLLSILSGMGQRVVAPSPTADGARALLLSAASGLDGLLMAIEGRTVDASITLLSHRLATPEVDAQTVRRAVCQCFDIVVEVARLGDGRSRVMRIVEPDPVQTDGESEDDIFDFVVERTATGGSIEGHFRATGRAPSLLKGLRARGIAVEEALFSRPPSD